MLFLGSNRSGTPSTSVTDLVLGDWPRGWQCCASRIRTISNLLLSRTHAAAFPVPFPSACALLRSQSGSQAGTWLTAILCEPSCAPPLQAMLLALRRCLRPLPLCASRCGPPACGGEVDAFGDHARACTRTGLIARRAKIVERARVCVAREAVVPDGQVVPQQWLAHTTAPNVRSDDRRRLDLVLYGTTLLGGALCVATLHPCRRWHAQVSHSLVLLHTTEQPCGSPSTERKPHTRKRTAAPNNSWCSGVYEVGGRWNAGAHRVPCPARSVSRAKRCFVGMGLALVDQTSRHEHSPRVSVVGTPPLEPTVGPRAGTRARPC